MNRLARMIRYVSHLWERFTAPWNPLEREIFYLEQAIKRGDVSLAKSLDVDEVIARIELQDQREATLKMLYAKKSQRKR